MSCCAAIGIFALNQTPLYFRCAPVYNDDEDLHMFVYSSVDFLCEKQMSVSSTQHHDLYSGLLLNNLKYTTYGYITNTQTKFIIAVDVSTVPITEQSVRATFKQIHKIYCNAICNPFYTIGNPVVSKKLDALVGI